MPNPALDKIFKQAGDEIEEEVSEKAVKVVKDKLRQLHQAKRVVKNIEREIEDLKDGFFERISDIKSNS